MSEDLKNCPFCDARVDFRKYNQLHHPDHPTCFLGGWNFNDGKDWWNTRAEVKSDCEYSCQADEEKYEKIAADLMAEKLINHRQAAMDIFAFTSLSKTMGLSHVIDCIETYIKLNICNVTDDNLKK